MPVRVSLMPYTKTNLPPYTYSCIGPKIKKKLKKDKQKARWGKQETCYLTWWLGKLPEIEKSLLPLGLSTLNTVMHDRNTWASSKGGIKQCRRGNNGQLQSALLYLVKLFLVPVHIRHLYPSRLCCVNILSLPSRLWFLTRSCNREQRFTKNDSFPPRVHSTRSALPTMEKAFCRTPHQVYCL